MAKPVTVDGRRDTGDGKPATIERDELIARFQLETDRALAAVREDMGRAIGDLARKVATLEDRFTEMRDAAARQAVALDAGLHHTRKAVEETNEAMKVAAKAAQEARDSALVYEKLKPGPGARFT